MNDDDMKYICIRLISGLKFIEFDDIERGKPCLKTSQGFKGCKLFLSNIEVINEILGIEASDRIYRDLFTNNYKALFPYPKKRFYRVDVLEASLEGYTSIWVNGERFEFNSNVIRSGKELSESWICLITLIFQVKDLIEERIKKNENSEIFVFEDELWMANIINVLKKFDKSWVEFEKEYITELISIESVARRFIMNLHKHIIDNKILNFTLSVKDTETSSMQEIQQEEKSENNVGNSMMEGRIQCNNLDTIFFELIKNFYRVLNLNSKHNTTENINLSTWEQIMQINELSGKSPHSCFAVIGALGMQCMSEMTILLEEVVDACKVPEKIDPHICNNLDLQQQMLRVDETWGIARKQFSKLVSMKEEDVDRLSLVQLVKLFRRIFTIQFRIRRIIKRSDLGVVKTGQYLARCSNEKHTWKNMFVEKLEECDVAALLALPKICCILYLMNPYICSDMITQFLSNEKIIELKLVQQDNEKVIEAKQETNQIFRGIHLKNESISDKQVLDGEKYTVENSFFNMVSLWNSFTCVILDYGLNNATNLLGLDKDDEMFNMEEILLVYIFSQLTGVCLCGENMTNNCSNCVNKVNMIQENEFIKKSKKLLSSLLISIEEVSILLQRVSVPEWNEFIHTAILCITKSPIISEEIDNAETSQTENENKCLNFDDNCAAATLDYGSSSKQQDSHFFAMNNTKIHSFLTNIGSIIYENVKGYGIFDNGHNSTTSENSDNNVLFTYSSSNSNFENSTDI
ncbi:hypothetical protein OJ253_1114 [Cryptosporidium canis]|uniref:Uncharacterized protein n=1 Tax=Cryptosporidium canis TaxID=195482 RepID=A0A9D5DHI3_9CRYT|nr:hypothetical protein OJ253_1114 [Cryptosporidium canis]